MDKYNSITSNIKTKIRNRTLIIILAISTIACTNIDKNSVSSETISKKNGVVIKKSEVTEEAKFFPYKSGDVKMELLAFKASDGTIRSAFNTCQICYDSGFGYYVQEGDVLVCQNCGNRYPAERVGIDKDGCNPIPIFEENRIEDDETITISGDYIDKFKDYFIEWNK